MTTTSERGSAVIYAFPPRGRFATARGEQKSTTTLAPERAVKVAWGSGWYHDEAIREAEQARKN